jgi:phospholipid/cholesterol/gamma-HCH transport system substrate-binding protein
MSISKAQRARLGFFMTAGIVLLAIFIIVPIGFRLTERQKLYHAYFEGESLSGLEEGSTVKFHGVAIGKVSKITYDANDLNRVKVTMKIRDDFPMKNDMYGQTGMMGITGLMYIEILGGSSKAGMLKAGSEIPTRKSIVSTITGKAEGIVAKIEILLNHLNAISNPDSLRSIKQILDNVEVITANSRSFLDNLRPNFEQMAGATRSVVTTVDSISRDVKVLTGGLRETVATGQLARIFASLDSTTRSLKALADNLNLTVGQTREDLTVTLQNLREASESADDLAKALAENPSLLIRGDQQKERDVR